MAISRRPSVMFGSISARIRGGIPSLCFDQKHSWGCSRCAPTCKAEANVTRSKLTTAINLGHKNVTNPGLVGSWPGPLLGWAISLFEIFGSWWKHPENVPKSIGIALCRFVGSTSGILGLVASGLGGGLRPESANFGQILNSFPGPCSSSET
jgi:hypothetical protein